ncbi:hypothetical protein [Wenjunlia tyrosinilytica]|uniref:Uncharacterized protein n=1 Tax=Wenjunlia tyrosinilytica TaxID=1544741 RepID=A0A917ZSQ0_9ACTN|nr:hypothetical protein [Wenjunlia tyrosinilytica]GGO92995.1 hypothetical protein GCM10012280_44460 [Wenjunlia tyrosinilytica]
MPSRNPLVTGPFGQPVPPGAPEIARLSAAAVQGTLRGVHAGLYRDPDVEETLHQIPMPRTHAGHIDLLAEDYVPLPDRRPPTAAPGAAAQWWQNTQFASDSLFAELEYAVRSRVRGIEVIGAKGDGAARLSQAQACREENRPFVSLSINGSLRNSLTTGLPDRMAVSILVWMSGALAAAVVTTRFALAGDCSSAYRLRVPEDEWEEITEDTTRQPADGGHVVLPQGMMEKKNRLRATYHDIYFADVTSAAITDALLAHSAPAGVNSSCAVLDAALALVAAAHGLTVRPLGEFGPAWKPWTASAAIMRALSQGTGIPDLVIARDEVTARDLAQLLDAPA